MRVSRHGVEVVHRGCGFAEGPVVLAPGEIDFCDGTHGLLLHSADGRVEEIADVGGAPNGAALGDDGALYVARIAPWHPLNGDVAPAVLRVGRDGAVATVATGTPDGPFVAPNDVAFGPDGRLFLTDSGDLDHVAPTGPGRIHALAPSGVRPVLELPPCFVNGLAFDEHGALVWTESATRRVCRRADGVTRVLATLPAPDVPDGLAIAADGRLFVATVSSRAIVVLAPDGDVVDRLALDAEPTNCAFDGSTLVVTASTDSSGEPGSGMLLAVETDARALPLHAGRA